MIYSDFNAAIRLAVWPDGEPENLVSSHKNYILDALIDLQIKVPRLQTNHVDFIQPEDTLFNCGASLFDAPRGFIASLSVLRGTPTRCCDEAPYLESSKSEFDCFLGELEATPCSVETHPYQFYQFDVDGPYYAYPSLAYCLDYPTQSIDSVCAPSRGYYALFRRQIWMAPHIQSGYVAKLLWDGIKRTFADTDILDEDYFDREVLECVELYLRSRAAAIDDCDYTKAIYFSNENPAKPGMYQIRRADLIHTGEKESRLPKRNYCFSPTISSTVSAPATSSPSTPSDSPSSPTPPSPSSPSPSLPSIQWRSEGDATSTVTYTFVESDRGDLIYFESESLMTVTLPDTPGGGTGMIAGWYVDVKNTGGANVNIVTEPGTLINGVSLLVLLPGVSLRIVSNGTSYVTFG